MKKIICPVDFSGASLNAIEFAARIGAKHHSSLTLLYVFTEEEYSALLEHKSYTLDEWKQKAEGKLANLAREVNQDSEKKGLARCIFETSQGNLTKAILERAGSGTGQCIVMGTNGASDVTETYVGSNTVDVIEKTNCPVLCIPEKAQYHQFRKIVYASNYQEEDKRAIRQLADFSRPFGGEITVLHISHRDRLLEKALQEDFKREVLHHVNYPDMKFVNYLYKDAVNLGLDQYMVKENAALLVLLTRHRNLFDKIFSRSLSQKMSYFVDYPLLLYKMGEE